MLRRQYVTSSLPVFTHKMPAHCTVALLEWISYQKQHTAIIFAVAVKQGMCTALSGCMPWRSRDSKIRRLSPLAAHVNKP